MCIRHDCNGYETIYAELHGCKNVSVSIRLLSYWDVAKIRQQRVQFWRIKTRDGWTSPVETPISFEERAVSVQPFTKKKISPANLLRDRQLIIKVPFCGMTALIKLHPQTNQLLNSYRTSAQLTISCDGLFTRQKNLHYATITIIKQCFMRWLRHQLVFFHASLLSTKGNTQNSDNTSTNEFIAHWHITVALQTR